MAAIPSINDPAHLSRGYGSASHLDVGPSDFANGAAPAPAERRGRFDEDFDARTRGSSIIHGNDPPQRSASRASRASSTLNQGSAPSRSGTLKKKGSIKRSGSKRSLHAGSIRGVEIDDPERGYEREDSIFYTPVPTKGAPTEVLADRFQAWRKFLKDLITYFREVASSYEHRAKALLKVSNVINNTNAPASLLGDGGLGDANRFLRDYHKQAVVESNKARDIESDVINQLSSLRADLAQKIKEIKSLSGDFKNNVEKEKETTRKCVAALEEALAVIDTDPSAIAGKGDPYVVRLGVERQVERQIDEENYLHKAYLNLENSGRELESIVVGEVQKAYNALATILKRDADELYSTVEKMRTGPLAMPRDHEWGRFVRSDPHFVNPDLPLRRLEDIGYPGKHHPATAEVRAGMLERKSKYLKSYTPGWYVLSPTHIHEFKSADRIYTQPPVMSLYLPDQKLGSRSQPGSSSHKFVIKGRQAGSMHRGHTWVFRAETYETMLAWYDDIKALTEKSGEERDAFVRRHASVRSTSAGSARSASSDGGLEEDEADAVPYSANQSMVNQPVREEPPTRPSPGGRFPSDLQVNRHLHEPLSPSSDSSDIQNDLNTMSGGLNPGGNPSYFDHTAAYQPVQPQSYIQPEPAPVQQHQDSSYPYPPVSQTYGNYPVQQPQRDLSYANPYTLNPHPTVEPVTTSPNERLDNTFGNWMVPAAGVAAGALAGEATRDRNNQNEQSEQPRGLEQHFGAPSLDEQGCPVDDFTGGTQVQPRAEDPIVDDFTGGTQAQPIPYQDPTIDDFTGGTLATAPYADHVASSGPAVHPATIITNQARSARDDGVATPTANSPSFLEGAEAPAVHAGKTINGGPVPLDLVETAEATPSPGVHRKNTDISVSDLHVPGQYPRGPVTPGAAPGSLPRAQ